MERNVDLNEITDGRFYSSNDLVKVGCDDCKGCSACCRGMGDTIVLDPLDMFRLMEHFKLDFDRLVDEKITLSIIDGLILPHLRMAGEDERCVFLNREGRCSIHSARPGICRMFPLGRYYEGNSFRYILQVHECVKQNRTKVKVKKWIDTPDLKRYEPYINDWHYFLKGLQNRVSETQDESLMKNASMYILQNFYRKPYEAGMDFYEQFYDRLREAKKIFTV